MICGASAGAQEARLEYALDVWDWTSPCRDLAKFSTWTEDFKEIGGTRMEISAPWNVLEPEEGKYDLSFVADRLKIARGAGLGLRVRINSFFYATPAWLKAEHWRGAKGEVPEATPNPVSICDERFVVAYGKLCRELAKRFAGEDVYWSPFIGVHAELKWSDWWSFDPATMRAWEKAIVPGAARARWLSDVVGDEAALPRVPAVPLPTAGREADASAQSRALIAFREHAWRETLAKFDAAIREEDPRAKTSAPLGESYRSASARMSNLDYAGMSRAGSGFDQVVHSYDFFWHAPGSGTWESAGARSATWQAGASVAAFVGMTRRPVIFEFDTETMLTQLGYSQEKLAAIADAVLDAGAAGVKVANASGSEALPSTYRMLRMLGEKVRARKVARVVKEEPGKTTLLFVSKWATYCHRDENEWLHELQFGTWKKLVDAGEPVRFVCEDNLDEELAGYRKLVVVHAPAALMPRSARERLEALKKKVKEVVEVR
jgi:hypothetical protein